jgi:hypothetical protein
VEQTRCDEAEQDAITSKSHIICLSRGSGFLGGPSCSCGCIRPYRSEPAACHIRSQRPVPTLALSS